jgi:hypothetical protein
LLGASSVARSSPLPVRAGEAQAGARQVAQFFLQGSPAEELKKLMMRLIN